MLYYIIVYKSTHDAMCSERILNENKFEFKIMPTPTSITQSCGICMRFNKEEEIEEIIKNNIVQFKNIYKKDNKEGFMLVI